MGAYLKKNCAYSKVLLLEDGKTWLIVYCNFQPLSKNSMPVLVHVKHKSQRDPSDITGKGNNRAVRIIVVLRRTRAHIMESEII